MRKPAFCICENKDADQLRGNREADQRLCFCYIASKIPLHTKLQASRHVLWLHSPACVGPGQNPENRFSHKEAHLFFKSPKFSDILSNCCNFSTIEIKSSTLE